MYFGGIMKRRIITLIAMAIVLCLACLMMVSCDETVKDSGGGIILDPSQEDASTDTPKPVQQRRQRNRCCRRN